MQDDDFSQELHNFGNVIRRIRHEQGLSQEAFADLCGLDRTYVGGVERGERNVSFVNIQKIAKALNTPTSRLFQFVEGSIN